jgi:glycosyltransferase involved in cell wall biosynthesis
MKAFPPAAMFADSRPPYCPDPLRACQDVAAGTGWLVPPDDEDALADALVTAASDAAERRRRGARAYRHSHTHYGWPLIAARIGALYAELLAASPRAARA